MAYRWAVIGVLVLLLLVGFQGERNKAFAQRPDKDWICKVISVQGRVLVKRQGEAGWKAVGLNDTLSAGDQIRVEDSSRAGIVLSNDAVLRLDQNTTLVFTEIEKETTFIFKLLRGAANFFSRRARSLKIFTPFVNGVVEGTEFYVQVDAEQTRIDLFEGRVLAQNPYGELLLVKGQGAVALSGSAPRRHLLVQPRDSVQWALYYPPVLVFGPDEVPDELKESLKLYNQGQTPEAVHYLEQVEERAKDAKFFAFRAALLLHLGRISQARDDIRRALATAPDLGEALALQAVIAVVQNRKAEALKTAQQAVQVNPQSAAAQMALSYAHQAGFDLTGALKAAQAAVKSAPENGTAWARLAELRLSTGKLDQGIQAARKAAQLNPNVAHAHTMLGFAYLTQIKTEKAREAFEKAIALDSAAPLPRLGLGLAKIRDGDLEQGRSEIEIAAGLDPANALIRSYLGKAYFDEKRGPLDETQFEIAKALDPNDPTPWFYDAIRKQTLNRPGEALQDLQKSIELNNNRAVYRSRLLLDEDLAARSASLGRIYSDLGFEQLALSEGWKAVNTDHGDYSGHRLLADSYSKLRRHEIARASELLQSMLLQPLNITPLQPQLGETNLLIPEGVGPARISFNEFNPLFTREGVRLQASGVAGSYDTLGDELTFSGLYKNFSFSLGQLHYETEGFRDNNDLTSDIYKAFAQVSLSAVSSIQLELRSWENERGDLLMLFDPNSFTPKRTEEKQESIRIGGNLRLSAHDNLIISLIHSEMDICITDRSEVIDPFIELTIDSEINTDSKADFGELQYLHQSNRYEVIAGLGFFNEDQTDTDLFVTTTTIPPLPPDVVPDLSTEDFDTHHSNAYLYAHWKVIKDLTWTIGISYDSFKSPIVEEDKISPKTGFTWAPYSAIKFRAAWLQNMKRPYTANQTLEPTQVAGFNQLFDDFDGSETERYGVAVDAKISSNIFGGVEFSWRNIDRPSYDIDTNITTIYDQQEKFHRAYVNWMPNASLALSLEGFIEEFDNSHGPPSELTTYRYPLGISYHSSHGLFAKAISTHVNQKIKSRGESQSDNFWVVDLSIGYRLPKRLGTITFGIKNLFDEQFNFQDYNFNTDEPLTPYYIPEALVFGQVTLAF